jgi:hypothetical protein
MIGKKPFTAIAILFFSLVAVAQILRVLIGVEIIVNGFRMPLWVSAVAAVISG